MLTIATNWSTVSSFATGVGTLVLAIATFAAVRSSQRSARIAEEALVEQRRPILTQSRLDDPVQKIMFVERRWVAASGGHGVAEHDGSLYFAMSLRNVGEGIGVCQAWHVATMPPSAPPPRDHTPEDQFRLQTRDLYIPAGDIGMWQGALRDRNDPTYQAVAEAIDNQGVVSIELLYSDQVGEQRTISRFALFPYETRDDEGRVTVNWFAVINRHWYLDRVGPRSEDQVAAATDVILREREAAERLAAGEAEAAEAQDEEAVEAAAPQSAEPDQHDRAEADGIAPARVDGAEPVPVIPRPSCE
jgi:hypothetical protein